MPRISFTPNLRRHLEAPSCELAAETVRDALDAVFVDNPRLRSYLLDDQARLRKHVVIFVDGEAVVDRRGLSDALKPSSEILVMQALSGG